MKEQTPKEFEKINKLRYSEGISSTIVNCTLLIDPQIQIYELAIVNKLSFKLIFNYKE